MMISNATGGVRRLRVMGYGFERMKLLGGNRLTAPA